MDVYHTPQYLPDPVFEIIFSNLELSDLLCCMLVCKNWYRVIKNGWSGPWKLMCHRKLPKELQESEILSQLKSPKAKLRALYHSWNPDGCIGNVDFKQSGFTLHFTPIGFPMSPKIVHTNIGYMYGKHVWEVTFTGQLGSFGMIGVSSRYNGDLNQTQSWLIKESWYWNLVNNNLWHNGEPYRKYPLLHKVPKYKTGIKLQLVLDCEKGFMYFKKYNEFLGIAFYNLPKTKLYPTVFVYNEGDPKISIVYIGNTLCG